MNERRVVIAPHEEPQNTGLYYVTVYGSRGIVDRKIGCSPFIALRWRDHFKEMIRDGRPFWVDRRKDEKRSDVTAGRSH